MDDSTATHSPPQTSETQQTGRNKQTCKTRGSIKEAADKIRAKARTTRRSKAEEQAERRRHNALVKQVEKNTREQEKLIQLSPPRERENQNSQPVASYGESSGTENWGSQLVPFKLQKFLVAHIGAYLLQWYLRDNEELPFNILETWSEHDLWGLGVTSNIQIYLYSMYIRIVGTHNTVNKVFHIVAFECMFTNKTFTLDRGLIVPTENVATVADCASVIEGVSRSRNALLNGDTKNYDWDSGYTCHQLGSGAIVVQLAQPYMIGSIQQRERQNAQKGKRVPLASAKKKKQKEQYAFQPSMIR
ncbi:BTB/POZ domain-containing protein 9, partial [Ophiophagus hannah]